MSKKRILRALQIFELSAVDKPAQEGARAVIMKRDVAKEIDPLDTDTKGQGTKEGEIGGEPRNEQKGDTMTDAEKLAKAEKDLQDKDAELAVLKSISKMTDAEKVHYEGLDDEGAAAFLKMAPAKRVTVIEKAAEADKVVYKDLGGREYRASDAPATVALAKENDENKTRLVELEKAATETVFAKRAADELGHLPGEDAVKCALLKAISSIEDEATREAAEGILKASDAGLGDAMKKLGTTLKKEGDETPADRLDALAKKYQAENDGISYEKAYDAATKTTEGRALYAEVVNA